MKRGVTFHVTLQHAIPLHGILRPVPALCMALQVTQKAATKLKRVVEKEETWTPTEVPTTHSPSPSPSAVPTEHPTLAPSESPTLTPTFRMTATPCVPQES